MGARYECYLCSAPLHTITPIGLRNLPHQSPTLSSMAIISVATRLQLLVDSHAVLPCTCTHSPELEEMSTFLRKRSPPGLTDTLSNQGF